MVKGFPGLLITFILFITSGCSSLNSQDIATHTGISIARRGASLITPVPAASQFGGNEVSTDIDQSPAGSITGIEENQQVQPTNSIDQIEASPEPTKEPTTSPSQTPDVRLTQETDLVSGDQQESCIVDYNRNFEAKVIELINQEREKEGLKPLTEQAQLTQAARLHSEDMACNKFFSHDSPTSGNVDTRVTDQGYQYSAIGENIAGGYDTPSSVVEGWMDSTGHRANILNGSFTQIGVGYVILEGSQLGVYWTLLIGAP